MQLISSYHVNLYIFVCTSCACSSITIKTEDIKPKTIGVEVSFSLYNISIFLTF